MNSNNNEIETLLVKYCEGTATLREIEQVEAWMAESDENYQQVKQLYLISLATDTKQVSDSIDLDSVLSDVHSKIQSKKNTKQIPLKPILYLFQRWAAILFIPVTISLLVLLLQRGGESQESLITVSTNPGMISTFRLPDSTLVSMNSNSKLIYPSHFTGKTRNVTLIGEAYFEVTKDAKHSFILSTPDDTKVKVLGTKFNVEAYKGTKEISTTLLEGSVHFLYQKNGSSKYVSLKPLEKVIYNINSNSTEVVKTSCMSELAWKDGKIIFDNTSLKEALKRLKKRFNVEFIVRNKKYLNYRFTGTFITQQLGQILMNFKISSNIQWRYLRESPSETEKAIVELY